MKPTELKNTDALSRLQDTLDSIANGVTALVKGQEQIIEVVRNQSVFSMPISPYASDKPKPAVPAVPERNNLLFGCSPGPDELFKALTGALASTTGRSGVSGIAWRSEEWWNNLYLAFPYEEDQALWDATEPKDRARWIIWQLQNCQGIASNADCHIAALLSTPAGNHYEVGYGSSFAGLVESLGIRLPSE